MAEKSLIILYTLLFYAALPLIFLRLYWRGQTQQAYRQGWAERLGFTSFQLHCSTIWIHAVSLGEMVAVTPLIEALLAANPAEIIVLTTTTPTGRTHAQNLVKKWPHRLYHSYLPYDLPLFLKRFIKRSQPKMLIVMETELWPHLFQTVSAKKIPLLLINARISDQAFPRYEKIRFFMPSILKNITLLIAQSEADRQRFIHFGMNPENTITLGNIKYDLPPPAPAILKEAKTFKHSFPNRFVLIAASTHPGEEALFIRAYQALKPNYPELLLVLVPRHPHRFETLIREIEATQLKLVKRSDQTEISEETDIFLGNSMGELSFYYALSDLAFVGGSLVPIGGHNILEPAALGLPILFGPHMNNARQIARDFLAHHAAYEVTAPLLNASLTHLINHASERSTMGQNALDLLAQNRGILQKLLQLIEQQLEKREGRNKSDPKLH